MAETVLRVEHVGMRFNLSKERVDSLKDYILTSITRQMKFDEFWALKDINFTLEKGERIGILGTNGAGKSTLLKVIAGVFKPTEGSVVHKGKIVPLLELGAGFDKEYTGRENIYLYGAVLGYSKEFIDSKFDEIVKFSGLKKFLDVPLKNYSSGMKSRLGFSIATIVEPEILILDEPTTGLDPQTRLLIWNITEKLRTEENMTVFLTTHYMEEAAGAGYVVILEKGSIAAEGTPLELKNKYVQDRISLYGVSEEEIKALNHTYKEIRDGYEIMVKNTQEATKLIVEHQELFRDYEVVKGAMDDVFLAVTGNRMGGVQE